MAKAIKVENGFQVVGIYPNVKQALKGIEQFSGCTLAEDVKPHSVNKFLNSIGSDSVENCFGVRFYLELV